MPSEAFSAGAEVNTPPIYFTGQDHVPLALTTPLIYFIGQAGAGPLSAGVAVDTAAIYFTGITETANEPGTPALAGDANSTPGALADLNVEGTQFGKDRVLPPDTQRPLGQDLTDEITRLRPPTAAPAAIDLPTERLARAGDLVIDRFIINGRPAVGHPVDLSIMVRNGSDRLIEANRRSVVVGCESLRNVRCQILTPTVEIPFQIVPGEARRLSLPGAIKPQSAGQFSVTVTPLGNRQRGGRTVALRVDEGVPVRGEGRPPREGEPRQPRAPTRLPERVGVPDARLEQSRPSAIDAARREELRIDLDDAQRVSPPR